MGVAGAPALESPHAPHLHLETALLEDIATTARTGRHISLKMECFQPTGSFKIRGIGLLCQRSVLGGVRHLISSSGGNAGLAVAYSARKLGVAATVVVPSTTPGSTRDLLSAQGAAVLVQGDVWDEADERARQIASVPEAAYVPPFDHPVLWQGHATLIDEIAATAEKPDAVVVAVGGGGLLCGVLEGLHRNGWGDVRVIAVETHGAESLHRAIEAGHLITLPAITSIAKSLGARRVASEALAWAGRHPLESVVVPDDWALESAVTFAHSHRVFVEPACGAALTIAHRNHDALRAAGKVVVVVCGGVGVGPVMESFEAARIGSAAFDA